MSASTKGPVKTVVQYRVRAGQEAEFDEWIRETIEVASRSPGLEGSSVLASGGSNERFLLLRFAGADDLDRWESSSEYADLRRRGERLTTSGTPQIRGGLATWFTLPENRTAADPPPWKMAVVTWCALYPQIVALGYLTRPLAMPPQLDQALTSMLCVATLTWWVMPFLTRRLQAWLVGSSGRHA